MNLKEISPSFDLNGEGLKISGVKLEKIIRETGTPVFIYDAETIKRQYDYLRSSLPENVEIFYSCKANPNLAVIKLLSNLGAGIEIASSGELSRVGFGAEVNPNNMVYAGPGKTREALERAISAGIYSINAESEGEIRKISEIATRIGRRANVSLRINPEFTIEGATLKMGGRSKPFGIDQSRLEENVNLLLSLPNINPSGIHVFSASNVFSTDGLIKNLEESLKLAEQMNNLVPVKSIDVGAGFGIPYNPSQSNLSFEGLREGVSSLLDSHKFIGDNNTRLIVELGRYLVGQSGIYVTSVLDKKRSGDLDYIITDGGVHHMTRIPLLKDGNGTPVDYPIFNLSRQSQQNQSYRIAGCLCTPLDVLGQDKKMPVDTREGDYMGVFCAGAYGFSEGMINFLSHDIPAEVMVHNGKFDIVNLPLRVEESISRERIPREFLGRSA